MLENYSNTANIIRGKDPEFIEDDIFRIIVPLDDEYSFDYGTENSVSIGYNDIKNADKMPINADKMPINNLSEQKKRFGNL